MMADVRKVQKIDVEKMVFPEEIASEKPLMDFAHRGKGTIKKVRSL